MAAQVDEAAHRLRGVARETPLELSTRLSDAAGAEVWLKREDLQIVRSYKVRGAFNFIAQVREAAQESGVVCASAGNHAQGVAWACRQLGIPGRIYLPRTTPRQKRDRIRELGGDLVDIVMIGETFDEAQESATGHGAESGALVVPPFDDPRTIAGQGTVAREIVDQLGRVPDRVVVPVGGGGLIAGMASWLRDRSAEIEIVGVEPAGAASMTAALRAGRPVTLDRIDGFVDGAAVRTVGRHTFDLVNGVVDRVA
ncbi:MAG: pyridoxal-phosphate dependent enzyme, partial [Actinomycetales bacterium]